MSLVLTYDLIAKRIDHSLLGPTLTDNELELGCKLAAKYGVASVCIKPYAVQLAARLLAGSGVAVGTTVGFPHGGHATAVKVFEARKAMDDGATELDMVINIGQAIGGNWDAVAGDIAAVTRAAHERGALVKVIFENCYLNDAQKLKLCELCGPAKADYVKTSTGYGTGGATQEDLTLMRQAAPPHVKLKAAGGVRTLDGAIAVVELGCDRFGASKTAEILDELKARLEQV
jgi:deoxyribose-phosphate aldolase